MWRLLTEKHQIAWAQQWVDGDRIAEPMKRAVIASEDSGFVDHHGIEWDALEQAWSRNQRALSKATPRRPPKLVGGSTITQQLSKNLFLSGERTMPRKAQEFVLTLALEAMLSKQRILELYLNHIFRGQRAYGTAGAAQIYYGKPLADISVAEAAMLAGLPKAPSAFNPVVNPKRAKIRQQYVLRRMHELGFIDAKQHEAALKETLVVKRDLSDYPVHAEFVAEMARQIAAEQFPDEVYTRGFRITTTLTRDEQQAAYASLRRGVMDYDRRHGYRGAESFVDLGAAPADQEEFLDEALQDVPDASPEDVAFFREYAGMSDEEKDRYRQALQIMFPDKGKSGD